MLNFFETIIGYLELIWDFFLNLINSILSLITAVAGAVVIPPQLLGLVFGPLGACIISVTGFAVVKIIIGRSSV